MGPTKVRPGRGGGDQGVSAWGGTTAGRRAARRSRWPCGPRPRAGNLCATVPGLGGGERSGVKDETGREGVTAAGWVWDGSAATPPDLAVGDYVRIAAAVFGRWPVGSGPPTAEPAADVGDADGPSHGVGSDTACRLPALTGKNSVVIIYRDLCIYYKNFIYK